MDIETQIYHYTIKKNGMVRSGENFLSKIKNLFPSEIYDLIIKGYVFSKLTLDNTEYSIGKSDSSFPGIYCPPISELN